MPSDPAASAVAAAPSSASDLIYFTPATQGPATATAQKSGWASAARSASPAADAATTTKPSLTPGAATPSPAPFAEMRTPAFADRLKDAGTASATPTPQSQAQSTGDTPAPTALTPAPAPQAALIASTPALAAANTTGLIAQLSAQVAKRATSGASRFDFALEPLGLGRVDVSLKIDSSGQLSAALSFDNPSTASEAKSRAGELQQALQQAGFDVSQSGLSFTSGGGQGQSGGAFQGAPGQAYASPTPSASSDAADPPRPPSAATSSGAGGVDITI
jgi:hypothetical protein